MATLPTPTRETMAIDPLGHSLVAELSIASLLIRLVIEIVSTHSSRISEDEIQPVSPHQYDMTSLEGVPPPEKDAISRKVKLQQSLFRNAEKVL